MSLPFTITHIEVRNQTTETGSPLVYAVNTLNSFEWGVSCSGTMQVPHFPILKVGNQFKNISFLQVSTNQGQYQLYWNDGAQAGDAIMLVQCLTTDTPYPNNQKNLMSLTSMASRTFKLVIDLAVNDGFGGISLVDAE